MSSLKDWVRILVGVLILTVLPAEKLLAQSATLPKIIPVTNCNTVTYTTGVPSPIYFNSSTGAQCNGGGSGGGGSSSNITQWNSNTVDTGAGNSSAGTLRVVPATNSPAQSTKLASAVALGYQQITSLSSATALTVPGGATTAVITCETQAVRFRDDGTNPTASVGYPLAVGQSMTYVGTLSALKFIEQTASAKLDILYYQ